MNAGSAFGSSTQGRFEYFQVSLMGSTHYPGEDDGAADAKFLAGTLFEELA